MVINDYREKAYYFAIKSRIAFILLSILSNILLSDHTSDGFKAVLPLPKDTGWLETVLQTSLHGFCRWDAEHFLHITVNGYTFENNVPFFPGLPFILSSVSWVIDVLSKPFFVLSQKSIIIFSSVLINSIAFVKATMCLYDLTLDVMCNKYFAFKTAIFFCLTPALIFFISPYTESLYSLCVFYGIMMLNRGQTKTAIISFAASTCLRSNGILNSFFMVHFYLYLAISRFHSKSIYVSKKYYIVSTFLKMLWSTLLICLPYIVFQIYIYSKFCNVIERQLRYDVFKYGSFHNLTMPGDRIDWCSNFVPFSYGRVQEKYWNVGFLKYYEVKQIPNFILATPVILLVCYFGIPFCVRNFKILFDPGSIYIRTWVPYLSIPPKNDFHKRAFPYACHAVCLTVFCCLFVNIQVTTRIICSASPFLYWIAASCYLEKFQPPFTWAFAPYYYKHIFPILVPSRHFCGNLVILYFISYAVVGTILFSNNYPWT